MNARVEPVSDCERRFWFGERISGGARTVLLHIEIDGLVDDIALAEAVRAVCARHEALRTGFELRGTSLVRRLHAEPNVPKLVRLPADLDVAKVHAELTAVPFDLEEGPLLRVGLRGQDLFVVVHHIVFDGLSGQVFTADLAAAYRQALEACDADLGVLVRRPRPVITPQRRDDLVRYWRGTLRDAPDLPDLGVRTSLRELAGAPVVERTWSLPVAQTDAVRAAARAAGTSLFAVALWAFAVALGEVADADDFCVGTVFADRPPGTEREIGAMINMLPIRMTGVRARDGLARAWKSTMDALMHSELPIEDIIAASPPADRRRMPLYQASLLYQSWPRTVHNAGRATLRSRPVSPRGSYAEVLLEVRDGESWQGVFQAPDLGAWSTKLDAVEHAFLRCLDGVMGS